MAAVERDLDLGDIRKGDIILVRGRAERFFEAGGTFKESKCARPAIVVWADRDGLVVAAPIYETGENGPALPWSGRPRIGIIRDSSNGLTRDLSQVGVDNAFFVQPKNLRGRVGVASPEDREIFALEFLSIARDRLTGPADAV